MRFVQSKGFQIGAAMATGAGSSNSYSLFCYRSNVFQFVLKFNSIFQVWLL